MLHVFARHESIIHGEYNGDNSITTSKEKLTQQVNNVALTHNTNYQAVTESLNAPRAENARQHQELTQLKLEMVNFMRVPPAYIPATLMVLV